MKILAIETATVAGSIAIVDDSAGLIGEVRMDVKVVHAERLMPSIEWLLQASGIQINDIDAYAVSIGPGSFTGLRIGLSTAKGFSYATGKPVVPVPTLDAFARTLPFCPYIICPILDARKNQVYAAFYKWNGSVCNKIMSETAISPADLLNKLSEPAVFMGDGVKSYGKLISDTLQDKAIFAPASRMSPAASTVGEIALEKLKQGIVADPVSLVPLYIRRCEAEVLWKG